MKKSVFFLITALFICNPGIILAQRGTIEQAVPLALLSPAEIMQNLHPALDEQSYILIDHLTYKTYSVQAVKIIYRTIDAKGNPTLAAGVVFLPVTAIPTYRPVFNYLHGTLTKFADVPSNLAAIESSTGWIMAMDGYIAVLPDYIGMGISPGIHPYCHAASEASASIDLLKAMNQYCSNPSVLTKPDGNLYMTGYSQGAHAVLATQRELERNPLPFLKLRKTVAGSGAYSMSYVQKNFMFDHPNYDNPSFIPYLVLAYQSVYGNLYSNLNEVFVPPYSSLMPGFFNGSMDVEEIDSQLPPVWKSMFVPSWLSNFQYRYFHPLNVALRNNDLIGWKPVTDLRLYYSTADELVPKENSILAYLSFLLKGSNSVTCLPVGNFSHLDCATIVLLLAKIQFDGATGASSPGIRAMRDIAKKFRITEEEIAMVKAALNEESTLDVNEAYSNELVSRYLAQEFEADLTLEVYPNPANSQVFVVLPSDLPANSMILIYDMVGKLVHSGTVTGSLMCIDVKTFQHGLYKIMVTGLHTLSGKLMINR